MRFSKGRWLALGLLGQVIAAGLAGAVDQGEIKIEGRWSVVGVIAGEPTENGHATGIAVLRSNLSKKTYTLTVGDSVPNEFGFVLKSVQPHSVQIASASSGAITLTFADTPPEVAPEPPSDGPSRANRFLDSYYRTFTHNRGDQARGIADDDDDDGDVLYMPAPANTGSPHLSTSHDESAGRAEAYRPRTYKMEEDGDGFSVSFDDEGAP